MLPERRMALRPGHTGVARGRLTDPQRASLMAMSPLPAVVAARILSNTPGEALYQGFAQWLVWLPALLVFVGALVSGVTCRPGRALLTLGTVGFLAVSTPALTQRPAVFLILSLLVMGFLTWLWRWIRATRDEAEQAARRRLLKSDVRLEAASVAAWGTLISWLFTLTYAPEAGLADWLSITFSCLTTLWWTRRAGGPQRWLPDWRTSGLVTGAWLSSTGAMLMGFAPAVASVGAVLPALIVAGSALVQVVTRRDDVELSPTLSALLDEPARLLALTFLALGLMGTLLLWLPMSHEDGRLGVLDAAFVSFSASCVTGLSTVDTPVVLSFVGELVLLALIQVGGLGIMAFSTAALVLLGRRMSVRHEATVAGMFADDDRGAVFNSLGRMLTVTFASEGAGAVLLTGYFATTGLPFGEALWKGVFTSISAFCNAGFALDSDSLMSYATSPFPLLVVGALILVGGLGPVVVWSLPAVWRGDRVPLAVRLTLVTSLALMLVPAVFFVVSEWSASMRGMGAIDRLVNAWFQSVTLRTAGFNSVDFTALTPATISLMVVVMFIGGATGSTAGGIKTTTLAVLVLGVWAALRGEAQPTAFGYRIGVSTLLKATAVATLGLVTIFVAFLMLSLTQAMPYDMALFETVSAVATVGLTLGGTARLDEVGKVIIILCMFAGRIGPLTLFLLLANQHRTVRWREPETEVPVG
jgi:trk system potassium uptake protein